MNNGQDPEHFGGIADRVESITLMEALLIGADLRHRASLADFAIDLYRGEMPRNEVADLLGLTPRHARRIVAALVKRNALISEGPRDPLHLTFSATLASRWM